MVVLELFHNISKFILSDQFIKKKQINLMMNTVDVTGKRQKVNVMGSPEGSHGAFWGSFVFYGSFEGARGDERCVMGLFQCWPGASQESPEA